MYRSDFEQVIVDDILQKHIELLEELALYSQVMCICKDNENNKFYLEECCDNWFSHTLTKEECIELPELFKEIANKI